MRRYCLGLLMLLSCATIGSAQNPVPLQRVPMAANGPVDPRVLTDLVVARIMAFDRNRDGSVAKAELPERMQDLVIRGDADLNGSLDATEVRTLALRPANAATVRGFQHTGGYTFGDQVGVSSRMHIEGAIDDLRLASDTKDRALFVARTFVDAREADVTAKLMSELEGVFTSDQLARFKTAVTDQRVGRVIALASPNDTTLRVFLAGTNGGSRFDADGLAPAQKAQAIDAIARFTGFRLGDADRSELLDQMKGILNDEERDNLRAALERRPLVKSGVVAGVVGGVVGGDVFTIKRDNSFVRPAVLITPGTPPPTVIR
jgi:hypothetical protein